MHSIFLLALVAGTAMAQMCHYSISPPTMSSGPKQTFEVSYLNTSAINLYLARIHEVDPAVGLNNYGVRIDVVCNVGPHWDYHLYQGRNNFEMVLLEKSTSTDFGKLSTNQRLVVKTRQYMRFLIFITKWKVGESALNTVSLSRDPIANVIHLTEGSLQVFNDLKVQISGDTPEHFLELPSREPPKWNRAFQFPSDYECIFSNTANETDYTMSTTGDMCFVNLKLDTWITVSLAGASKDSWYPESQFPMEDKVEIEERRAYVKTTAETISTLQWVQSTLTYWMIVLSKPESLLWMADMSGCHTVSVP